MRLGQLAWDPVCNKPVYRYDFTHGVASKQHLGPGLGAGGNITGVWRAAFEEIGKNEGDVNVATHVDVNVATHVNLTNLT